MREPHTWPAPARPPRIPALARCAPVELDEFDALYYGVKPLLRPSSGGFTDLLDLEAVDTLLADRGLRTPFLRIAKAGHLVSPTVYTGSAGLGAEVHDQVQDDRVLSQLAAGATVVLQGLHRLWPPLRDFCAELSGQLRCAVQANAYLTPPGSSGFATHYDTHDVFVLQAVGSKHWRVHEPVLADPLTRQPWGGHAEEVSVVAQTEPTLDTTLVAGDALYLPRGWLHSAGTQEELSLHITLGLRRHTRYTLVEALLELAASEPSLRESLPLGLDVTDPAQLTPHLSQTAKSLSHWLSTVDSEALARHLQRAIWPETRPEALHPLAQLAAIEALTWSSVLRRRGGLHFEVSEVDDRVLLRLPDQAVSLPGHCGPALRLLLAGRPVRVGELPGLDGVEDQLLLARRLLREGVIVPG